MPGVSIPLVLLAVLSLGTPSVEAQLPCDTRSLAQHTVRAGDHNYRPGHARGLGRAGDVETFTLSLKLSADAWFDPTAAGPIGIDGMDWNKAGGLSFASLWQPGSWRLNSQSALIGWRPAEGGGFAWCLYVNHADASFTFSEAQPLAAEACVRVRVTVEADCVTAAWRGEEGRVRSVSIPAEILGGRRVGVGPWFGGNRAAPQEMGIWARLVVGEEG